MKRESDMNKTHGGEVKMKIACFLAYARSHCSISCFKPAVNRQPGFRQWDSRAIRKT